MDSAIPTLFFVCWFFVFQNEAPFFFFFCSRKQYQARLLSVTGCLSLPASVYKREDVVSEGKTKLDLPLPQPEFSQDTILNSFVS